jgi:hypothetical protein
MSAVFTPNKNITEPASGSFNNAWATPVNSNWSILDTAFGGTTVITVTGVTSSPVPLTIAQYQPPNIEFNGTLSGNLVYQLPTGVGGIWTIFNAATGAFTLSIVPAGGSGIAIPQGQRSLIVSNGTFVGFAETGQAAAAQANAEAFATSAANTAQSNAETFATDASNLSSGTVPVAQIPALPASRITSGTVANAQLPNVFAGPGVTIAADPGTTPSGTFGDVFAYY